MYNVTVHGSEQLQHSITKRMLHEVFHVAFFFYLNKIENSINRKYLSKVQKKYKKICIMI